MTDDVAEKNSNRIAIFGGSFNPPHVGHVLCATLALCSGEFDAVHLMPVADHAFGKSLLPLDTRTRLTREAVAHLGPRVTVDPIEGQLPAPNYTVNTVTYLLDQDPTRQLTLIMGADTYLARHRWHDWARLEALIAARLMVFGRAGVTAPPEIPVEFTLPDISSTEIRRRVAAAEPYWWMVPEAVADSIESEALYR